VARPKKIQESLPILRRFLSRFAPELRQQRTLVAGSFAALFAEVFFRLLEPWPLGIVIDHVLGLGQEGQPPSIGALQGVSPVTLLGAAALMVVVVAGLRALAAYLSTVGFALVGNRVLTEVRNRLYRHLQELSLSFHTRARTGDLVVRAIGDVGMVREVTVTAMLPLLANLFILAGMLGVMFWMHWQLTLLALSTVPLFWLSTVRLGRRIQTVARKQRHREGGLAATAAESIGAIETVQALSLNNEFADAFVQQNAGSMRQGVQAKRLSARLERTVDVLNALATALVLWFGARIVLRGELQPGELVVFLTYLKSAFRPVRNFAKYVARLAKASAAAERVLEVLEQEPEVRDLPGAREADAFLGAVRFEQADFAYGSRAPVLRGVDVSVSPGQRVALVGRSGAGKTTLASAILRLHDPSRGRVLIDEQDIRDFTLASLRGQVSIVLQDTLLFAASIRDNIALGAAGADDRSVEEAARRANAHGFIMELPDGYDTMVGERGLDLSVGQRQRIAIARACISRAPIVILDEPLTGLDEENERAVAEALDCVTEGRTTFLVTHDMHQAARCDQILVIDDRRVAESGTQEELLRSGGLYSSMHLAQLATRVADPEPVQARAVAR
jgi:ATP-binding cassette subfamily B protein